VFFPEAIGFDSKSQNMLQSDSKERKWIWLFCLLAAVHVFVFSATFPFFNIVDEYAHFDLVVKYSHGHLPVGLETMSNESARYGALYGTLEYVGMPNQFPGGKFAPPDLDQPTNHISEKLLGFKMASMLGINPENSQSPLYYTLAAAWFKLGKILGLRGGSLLLWLRLLNVFFLAALIWLAHLTTRLVFPQNHFLRIGVPALSAFIPQTAFYSLTNDVLSPLSFGMTFIGLIYLLRSDQPNIRLGVAVGLSMAASYLVKISNLPLIAVAVTTLIFNAFHWTRSGKFRAALPAMTCLALCAGLPISLWRAYVKYNFGDSTGATLKMSVLGWTYKPFGEWWHHPIFTLHGFWIFISKLTATFWQGETLWHGRPLASPTVDTIYVVLTGGLMGVTMFVMFRRPAIMPKSQRLELGLALACIAAAVGFLAGLSVVFDFHDCFYPSRAHPYFTSGRLMLGAMIPFLLLFTCGLSYLLDKFSDIVKFAVLTGFILFMLASEVTIDWPVFASAYNWFHL
jgi:hypothetical protein